ncbi:MAG: ABC transporter permease subunit [Lentisphaeria bacterium]
MINPKLQQGFKRFRNQKRAFYSLVVLFAVLLLTLPAELLCNSRPLVVRIEDNWYFPVFKDYKVADFGGDTQVTPDYKQPYFWRDIGCDPQEAGLRFIEEKELRQPSSEEVREILKLFPTKKPEHPGKNAESNLPFSIDTKAETGGETSAHMRKSEALDKITQNEMKQQKDCWVLWPPVRYDYAYIPFSSRAGRVALASPTGGELPGSDEEIASSWVDGHYLGTDNRGRDVLARLIYGLRVSLVFGILLATTSTIIGAALGSAQGYYGGWIDLLGQRLTEMWGSLPRLYLLMILSSLLARDIKVLFVILNLTSWMAMSAYMRAEFLKGRNLDYVKAARALGVSGPAIMFRHILPNSLTPIITFFPFSVTGGILALVALDFLGLGVPSPHPSIGELLRQGQANLHALWIILPTFFVLSGTITLLTFIGDGLRNAFDPRKAA